MAWEQFVLPASRPDEEGADTARPHERSAAPLNRSTQLPAPPVNVGKDGDQLVVVAGGNTATFAGGRMVSWTAVGAELIDQPPELELWRAPIDNDLRGLWVPAVAEEWAATGLHRLQHRVEASTAGAVTERAEIVVTTRVAPPVAGLVRPLHVPLRVRRPREAGHLGGGAPRKATARYFRPDRAGHRVGALST